MRKSCLSALFVFFMQSAGTPRWCGLNRASPRDLHWPQFRLWEPEHRRHADSPAGILPPARARERPQAPGRPPHTPRTQARGRPWPAPPAGGSGPRTCCPLRLPRSALRYSSARPAPGWPRWAHGLLKQSLALLSALRLRVAEHAKMTGKHAAVPRPHSAQCTRAFRSRPIVARIQAGRADADADSH